MNKARHFELLGPLKSAIIELLFYKQKTLGIKSFSTDSRKLPNQDTYISSILNYTEGTVLGS